MSGPPQASSGGLGSLLVARTHTEGSHPVNHIDAIRHHHDGEHLVQPCKVGEFPCDIQLLLAELVREVTALPEPTLGLKGGVSRAAVVQLLEAVR